MKIWFCCKKMALVLGIINFYNASAMLPSRLYAVARNVQIGTALNIFGKQLKLHTQSRRNVWYWEYKTLTKSDEIIERLKAMEKILNEIKTNCESRLDLSSTEKRKFCQRPLKILPANKKQKEKNKLITNI